MAVECESREVLLIERIYLLINIGADVQRSMPEPRSWQDLDKFRNSVIGKNR